MSEALNTQWTRDAILANLHEQSAVLQRMGVKRIGLFGSYARNQHHLDSDMDFLVALEPFNFANWMDTWNFLEDHFECEIDLVPEKDLRDELRSVVLRNTMYVVF